MTDTLDPFEPQPASERQVSAEKAIDTALNILRKHLDAVQIQGCFVDSEDQTHGIRNVEGTHQV